MSWHLAVAQIVGMVPPLPCSVHLARRVLQLEKVNSSLRTQLKAEEQRLCEMKGELEAGRELLRNSQQPSSYLMSRVQEQSSQLQKSKERITELEAQLSSLKKDKALLVETKNQMAADLERLLNHREVSSCPFLKAETSSQWNSEKCQHLCGCNVSLLQGCKYFAGTTEESFGDSAFLPGASGSKAAGR